MARTEYEQLADQMIATVENHRTRQAGKYTQLPRLEGKYQGKNTSVKTPEQLRSDLTDFLSHIYATRSRMGGLNGVKSYLRHLAHTYGVEIRSNWEGPLWDFDGLLADPVVQEIIDRDVQKAEVDNQRAVAKDKRSILSTEVTHFELLLREMGLPDGLIVKTASIEGGRWNDSETTEVDLRLQFLVLPDALQYPLLATRHDELTPSTSIGTGFALMIDVVQTNNEAPNIQVQLTSPQIPSMILWHKFKPDELDQLAKEKTIIEQAVQTFNTQSSTTITEEKIAPILQFAGVVATRVGETVSK